MLTRVQWSYERSQVFLASMRNAVKDYKVHAYLEGYVISCREYWFHLLTENTEPWYMAASHPPLVIENLFSQN